MSASAVFSGLKPLDWGLARTDADGATFGGELARIGYAGEAPVGGRPVDAYFELHIEQGPELEAKGIQIGVVAGSYAVRGFDPEVHGETAHPGTTPMRSEERRVGAEWVSTSRSRWSPVTEKTKK